MPKNESLQLFSNNRAFNVNGNSTCNADTGWYVWGRTIPFSREPSAKCITHAIMHAMRCTCGAYIICVTYHTTTTTALQPFFRDHPGEPVPEQNFWTLWCKGRLRGRGRGRHTDYPARRHSIRINQCPPPPSPIFFTGRMPFLPPNHQRQSTEGNVLLTICHNMPSVLWHCWLGGRKGIRPVKNGGWRRRWVLVSPDGVAPSRMVGVSASVDLQLTRVVPEKGP